MEFKKTKINYIDIFFAIFHFFIILFSYFSLPSFIAYSLSAIIVSSFSLSIMTYLFVKNNPFYIYYNLGVLIMGFFFLSSILTNEGIPLIFIFFLILEVAYFWSLIGKNRPTPYSIVWGGSHILDYYKVPVNYEEKLELSRQKEHLKKLYKRRKNIILSMILNITFIIFAILSFLFV
ncbi:MAG: hypothetical protein ACFE9I_13090 [Candidatus Hermodarchaeota archaeon]